MSDIGIGASHLSLPLCFFFPSRCFAICLGGCLCFAFLLLRALFAFVSGVKGGRQRMVDVVHNVLSGVVIGKTWAIHISYYLIYLTMCYEAYIPYHYCNSSDAHEYLSCLVLSTGAKFWFVSVPVLECMCWR